MALVRTLARPMLSAVFISGGVDQLRHPDAKASKVEPVTDIITRSVPWISKDTETLVRVNGAVQVGAGALFALGRFPRLSALVLAASLVPTTAGGHRFWEETDPGQRSAHQDHFLKNAGLFAGLVFAALAGRGDSSRGKSRRGTSRPAKSSRGANTGRSPRHKPRR